MHEIIFRKVKQCDPVFIMVTRTRGAGVTSELMKSLAQHTLLDYEALRLKASFEPPDLLLNFIDLPVLRLLDDLLDSSLRLLRRRCDSKRMKQVVRTREASHLDEGTSFVTTMLAISIRRNGNLCHRKRPSFVKVVVVFRYRGYIQGLALTAAESVKPSSQSFRGRL